MLSFAPVDNSTERPRLESGQVDFSEGGSVERETPQKLAAAPL